jgi:hypothetical protein
MAPTQAAVDANDPLLQFKERPVQDGVMDGRQDLRLIVGTNVLCEPALARAITVSASSPLQFRLSPRAKAGSEPRRVVMCTCFVGARAQERPQAARAAMPQAARAAMPPAADPPGPPRAADRAARAADRAASSRAPRQALAVASGGLRGPPSPS